MNTYNIEVNEKERFLLWAIAAWFRCKEAGVTSSLMSKLYPGDDVAAKYREKYDEAINDRIIDIGDFLKRDRAK